MSGSASRIPAVDQQQVPRHIARFRGGKVQDPPGDLLDLREAPHGNLRNRALADGIGIEDVAALLDLPAAIEGITQVPAEVGDLDESERKELQDYIQAEFDLPDDELEEFIESAIIWAFSTYELYSKFVNMKKDEPEE